MIKPSFESPAKSGPTKNQSAPNLCSSLIKFPDLVQNARLVIKLAKDLGAYNLFRKFLLLFFLP